ncbi:MULTISPECIES: ABC transporter substrate-binding protein [Streptomyces]|jgi:ABC-type Fe3+-hydroxamate transport system, periplasmic component|uniref:ABC transporter substrate-binding protein n=1 Tax=Streptomyces fradiae ATCC 10745 = DSM 40063 TaxID=1319510 RepID=A0A1Y2NQM3_STRFR|nr:MULTISPECIES: ABC transporter substrate-binding protein [Streptomyces]KAF0650284.1 ABC transporter substrate-binding protein [Streptomyces fradiae ATCC 10745 = DSM 40063]OSY49248.1 Periplasmic binding protein [Streptomyces fradiae ATCC 10745 = DSM 40063]QEV12349.1 ABC transporter substrate-binding protein [Streptomyces fradiae ATCC 10745 = DSM 40063]
MPSSARASHLTRRGLLATGGALGLGAALAACGGGDDKAAGKPAGEGGAEKAGPWTFTDDRGVTAEAKATPKNIVAFTGMAAALHDFGVEVKGVFGPTKTADGKPDVQAGDLDVNKVEIIGNVWGEFDIEKYVGLQPDVLITDMWEKDALWYVPDESKDKILKLAPSVALRAADQSMPKVIQRHVELAESLGGDVRSKKVADSKARFEAAAARLRAAAKAKPEIRVLIGSASPDLFYVSSPARPTDTLYFKELGVNLVVPGKLDAGGWFENLSWENVGTHKADIIMMDNRTSAIQPEDLASKPTWAQLPAVKAGQVIPRVTEPVYSYEKCAPLLEDLAEAIENAKKVA